MLQLGICEVTIRLHTPQLHDQVALIIGIRVEPASSKLELGTVRKAHDPRHTSECEPFDPSDLDPLFEALIEAVCRHPIHEI